MQKRWIGHKISVLGSTSSKLMELSSFNFYIDIDDNSNMQNDFLFRQNVSLAKLVKEHKLILFCQYGTFITFSSKQILNILFQKYLLFYVIFVAL